MRLIYTIAGAVAAMKRELLIVRTASGLAAARSRGRVGGVATPPRSSAKRSAYDSRQLTIDQIARAIGSRTTTVYRYLTAAPSL